MHKRIPTFCEPLPYYMTAMGMQGARFIEGNNGTGGEQKPTEDSKPEAGKSEGDAKLNEPGKKALDAERKRADDLDKLLKAEQAKTKAFEDEKLSDTERKEKQDKENANELDKLRRENLRLTALAENPVPKEYQVLVKGDTKEELDAAAALVAQLVANGTGKPGAGDSGDEGKQERQKGAPVPKSGTGSSEDPKGFAAGEDLYKQRHKKD